MGKCFKIVQAGNKSVVLTLVVRMLFLGGGSVILVAVCVRGTISMVKPSGN